MKKKAKFILTNFVTLLRVVGIALLIPVYKVFGGAATALLAGGCFATDFLDGFMARKFETSSFFGSLFDGISDKGFLIVNMILLMSITPLAIIPIMLELGIASVQTLKYHNNLNVKSNIFGKAKMWVAGIMISLCYLLLDKNFLNYLGADLLTKISEINWMPDIMTKLSESVSKVAVNLAKVDKLKVLGVLITPVVASETITLGSYIHEYKEEKKDLTPEKIANKKAEEERFAQEIKDVELKDLLFEHEYYERYNDCGNLKLIRNLAKKRK